MTAKSGRGPPKNPLKRLAGYIYKERWLVIVAVAVMVAGSFALA